MRVCQHCAGPMGHKRAGAKFCARKCKVAFWHKEHPEYIRAKNRRWRIANPASALASEARYRSANREARREYNRQWERRRPELRLGATNRRRAMKLGAPGTHTPAQWRDKLELFANCCAYCGEAKPLTRDHNVPLYRGGSDDISNILPACRPCNSSKGTKTAAEFFALPRTVLAAAP